MTIPRAAARLKSAVDIYFSAIVATVLVGTLAGIWFLVPAAVVLAAHLNVDRKRDALKTAIDRQFETEQSARETQEAA